MATVCLDGLYCEQIELSGPKIREKCARNVSEQESEQFHETRALVRRNATSLDTDLCFT
jgi:hypothetical protein